MLLNLPELNIEAHRWEIEEFYSTYSKEIEEIQQENKVQHQTEKDRSWFALEKTTEKISKDLDLER